MKTHVYIERGHLSPKDPEKQTICTPRSLRVLQPILMLHDKRHCAPGKKLGVRHIICGASCHDMPLAVRLGVSWHTSAIASQDKEQTDWSCKRPRQTQVRKSMRHDGKAQGMHGFLAAALLPNPVWSQRFCSRPCLRHWCCKHSQSAEPKGFSRQFVSSFPLKAYCSHNSVKRQRPPH